MNHTAWKTYAITIPKGFRREKQKVVCNLKDKELIRRSGIEKALIHWEENGLTSLEKKEMF